MKQLLLASVAAGCMTVAAHAETAGNWAGSYIGVHLGYGTSYPDFEGDPFVSDNDFDTDGFVGGVYFGHDWQSESLVYGIAGDIDYLGFSNQEAASEFFGKTDTYSYDLDWVATARVRAGFTVTDDVLLYGTGGLALTQVAVSSSYEDPPARWSDSKNDLQVGGVLGAGIEYAFTPNWSLKTEYTHYFFDEVHVGGGGTDTNEVSFKPSFGQVRLGIAYRF